MEEEQAQITPSSIPQLPSSNHGIFPCCFSSSSSSSSSPSPVSQVPETEEREMNAQQEEDHHQQPNNRIREVVSNLRSNQEWDDAWSCFVVLLTICTFASMTVILGFYGSFNLELGPNSSYLIEASPIFVRNIKAEQKDGEKAGAMLYGFHKSPSLDLKTTWSQNHSVSVVPYLYKEWTYYLNAGSRLDISYDVKYPSSIPLFLVIAEGKESLLKWVVDPSYPNTTLSWNIIYGVGNIGQEITTSDTYYVAVGNLNTDTTLVDLNVTIHSLQYNTSDAYFKCSLSNHFCSFALHLFKPNSAILTSPGLEQVKDDEDWCFEVSFGAQWATYVCGSCMITVLILALFKVCNLFETSSGYRSTESGGEHEPLLSPKGDARSSWGSSYDSIPNDEGDDLEDNLLEGYPEGGKVVSKEGEANIPRRLCVVCFDAPRDCFFLPCGHCATCFTCGLRIAEEVGTCPICRRRMKKVRKIFAV